MPWVQEPSDPSELRRYVREIVALATSPAIRRAYDPGEIAGSVAAALVSILDPEFVHVSLPAGSNEHGIAVTRTRSGIDTALSDALGVAASEWIAQLPRKMAVFPNPYDGTSLHIAFTSIGLGSDALIVVGSRSPAFPSETQQLLIGIAANEATLALQRYDSELESRRFISLAEKSSDFIGLASLDGMAKYINAAGLQLVGLLGMAEASGMHVLDFLVPEERTMARDELLPLVMRDGGWVGELRFRHFQSDAAIPVLVHWFRIDDARSGRPMNTATVSRDLRAQKTTEAILRHLNETLEHRVARRTAQLAEANRKVLAEIAERERTDARLQLLQSEFFHATRLSAAGQMAAETAHELNQPLTAAANSVSAARRLLANGGQDALATAQEVMEEATEQILRGGAIIRRLRDFVSRGETDMQAEDVRTMIEEASALWLGGSESQGVKLSLRFGTDLPPALVNRIQIQQVLGNLIRNALDAMAGMTPRQLAITVALLDQDTIEVSVADTGPGIAKDIRSRLFEPFVSTKRNGMGLGLSICRSIIEAHGGRIRSEPNPGGGTVFSFTLAALSQ